MNNSNEIDFGEYEYVIGPYDSYAMEMANDYVYK
jgi:hypothetical protein